MEFDYLNAKIICLFLMLLLIKRELKIREIYNDIDYNLKFLSIQFTILGFIIAIIPSLIFFVPIYFFNKVSIKKIFSKLQIKKYCLFLIILICQNFMFFVYPSLIFDFLFNGFSEIKITSVKINELTPDLIVERIPTIPKITLLFFGWALNIEKSYLSLISIILLSIFIIIISFKDNIMMEYKFGYFTLFCLFCNVYIKPSVIITLAPLIILLFVDKIENVEKFKDFSSVKNFIKKNYLFLIVLLCLSYMIFIPPLSYIFI